MELLSKVQMKTIEDLLVDAGSKISADDRHEAANILATLRYELRCDNHELHRLYALQINQKGEQDYAKHRKNRQG